VAIDSYLPGRSVLHLLDPRAKLISLIVVVSCFFLPFKAFIPSVYLGLLSLAVCACLGIKELGKAILAIAPLIAVILVLTPLLTRGGRAIWFVFGFPLLTYDGLILTLRLLVRFMGITLAFYAVFRTIEANDLSLSLRWFGLSFRASLVLVIALRFIPSLMEVYVCVRDAHELRSDRKRGFFDLFPILTSMIIFAVKRIPTLAMALELRGFGRKGKRTELRRLRGGRSLVIHFVFAACLALALLAPLVIPL
jgi:energy-coupling factor transport system permease protein